MRSASGWTDTPIVQPVRYPELRLALREWWAGHGRRFPWRQAAEPYAVFLAEVVLQKTQVAKAERAYAELIAAYPTVWELAAAPAEHLEQVFTWLGLRKRAVFILAAARVIVERHGGQIPRALKELKQLPGIGDYSARAILCFAYGEAAPILDTTVARVLKRALGFTSEKMPWEDPVAWGVAAAFLDPEHPVEHNYALLDLAATICAPTVPRCDECPLQAACAYATALRRDSAQEADR